VPPASPDAHDARAAIDAALEPLRAETGRVDRELAANQAFLDERRSRGVDAETRDLLTRAASSPSAPESLRRVAHQVAAGQFTWDDVFARRAGADGAAFLDDALRTAREHFADAELAPVDVPDEALEVGIDPDEVAADIERIRFEARAAHDEVFRP
jgi:hypothetical protein